MSSPSLDLQDDDYYSYPFPHVNDVDSLKRCVRNVGYQSRFYSAHLHPELHQLRTFKLWVMKELSDIHDKIDSHRQDDAVKKRLESLQDSYSWIRNMVLRNEGAVVKVQNDCLKLEGEITTLKVDNDSGPAAASDAMNVSNLTNANSGDDNFADPFRPASSQSSASDNPAPSDGETGRFDFKM